ncbi:dihydrodipicolinate synthase family protein [Candidatus Parabeggiatoa sp. HSG14]|uniref:dihydrodipicolinate synthase family protein n=1 Tax=Candidatus Parabeggiatoa sp. HSG14 TaxID=3055593 RepID=UPI0025A8D172|nr:dihydrodipicolinate synthase family protein [Thiotrichales bacterium HSG14]
MIMKKISGPIFALLTPFDEEGKIDFTALGDYILFLQERGVETIVTNGTTGEFSSLSLEERMVFVEYCRKKFDGTILNNVSSCCLSDCLKLANHSKNYADALLVLPPYYYANVSEKGILSYFTEVLNKSPLPLYLYHFPKHSKNAITPKMVEILANKHENLAGVKDSEANLDKSKQFQEINEGNLQVFVGSDRLALKTLKNGLDGFVTGGGNAFPEFLIAITRYFQADDLEMAKTMQRSLDVWNKFRKQSSQGEIALIKIALQTRLKGFPIFVRLPLPAIETTVQKKIELFIEKKVFSLLEK